MKKIIIIFLSFFILTEAIGKNNYTDNLLIKSTKNSREYFFTNKISGFFYHNTNGKAKNGWQGWTIDDIRIIKDITLEYNSVKLNPKNSTSYLYPYKLKRIFNNKIKEELFLADSANYLFGEFANFRYSKIFLNIEFPVQMELFVISDSLIIYKNRDYFTTIYFNCNIKNPVILNNILRIQISCSNSFRYCIEYSKGQNTFNPILYYDIYLKQKKERIETLLDESYFESNLSDFDKALAWNKISLDALITFQGQVNGIWAGLPWFNNYWGRDIFISLPGATFCLNNFYDAKAILESFSNYQNADSTSKYWGRIPNRVTLNEIIYNTADGTPWFIIQSYNYFKYSGDLSFLKRIYPNIKLSNHANLTKFCDKNLFLLHEDAETWMDAIGPNGPWSPRGNRANDIQALWYLQLIASKEIANYLMDSYHYKFWDSCSQVLKSNINKKFIHEKDLLIFDHIKSNDTPDSLFRPNIFFLFNAHNLIDDNITKYKLLKKYFNNLVTEKGVYSLSPKHLDFFPFHEYNPFYVKDAAYHNGTIWIWNTGPVISSLLSFNLTNKAFLMTKYLVKRTLNSDIAGTLPELLDAFPKLKGQDFNSSGTFSQAWSIAEFTRNLYQDYLGYKPDFSNNSITFSPRLPDDFKKILFKVKFRDNILLINYKNSSDNFIIDIESESFHDSLVLNFSLFDSKYHEHSISIPFGELKHLNLTFRKKVEGNDTIFYQVNNNKSKPFIVKNCDYSFILTDTAEFKFADFPFNNNWLSIKSPDYKILKNKEVKLFNKSSKTIFSIDNKKAIYYNYQYPKNHNFKEGILNLTNFKLSCDLNNYYFDLKFEKLVDPGWHNEYGFQLTFVAIAINLKDSIEGRRIIGANSNYILSEGREFHRLVLVGGGIEIINNIGKVIARYLPEPKDILNPLGELKTNSIKFAISKNLIGDIEKHSKLTILVGAQDDHGGAGVGEFRSVFEEASEWNGGGKLSAEHPNIYQLLEIN